MKEKLDVTDLSEEENKVVKQDYLHFIPLFKIEEYCSKTPKSLSYWNLFHIVTYYQLYFTSHSIGGRTLPLVISSTKSM